MDQEWIDRLKIRELIDNWVLWRDANQWDRFRTVWHSDGRMMATWTQGTYEEFVEMSKQGFAKCVRILHFQGPSTIDIQGPRAIAFTKMIISQRAKVHDVLVDVNCTGRFCDFIENRENRWGIVLRQPSTKRTAWTRSTRRRSSNWTPSAWLAFPKATGTWRICNRSSAIP